MEFCATSEIVSDNDYDSASASASIYDVTYVGTSSGWHNLLLFIVLVFFAFFRFANAFPLSRSLHVCVFICFCFLRAYLPELKLFN